MDIGKKSRVPIKPFQLPVLGGTFTIQEFVMDRNQSRDEFGKFIKNIPSDRWFVMLAEEDESGPDTLAVIDDQFEFQIHAVGSFQHE